MKQRLPSMGLAIVILLIFIIASVINVWLLVERGPAPLRVIPAVGFIVAAVGWLFIIARIRKA
jgi:hypothetical protein